MALIAHPPSIQAVVPLKNLAGAKSRLAELLTPDERRALVLAMLRDVLKALLQTPALAGVHVVSSDAEVLDLARAYGAAALPDRTDNLNDALTQAAGRCAATGADAVLILPADVPLVTPGELEQFVAALDGTPGVVLAPSPDGGTNALLVRPPLALPFRFGPNSLAYHHQEARRRGLRVQQVRTPGLERDIDHPDDLLAILNTPGTTATRRLIRSLCTYSPCKLTPNRERTCASAHPE